MRSAHSRRRLPDILSSPVVLDLFNLFKSEKTLVVLVGRSSNLLSVCAREVPQMAFSVQGIDLTSKLWSYGGKMIIKLVRQLTWVCY